MLVVFFCVVVMFSLLVFCTSCDIDWIAAGDFWDMMPSEYHLGTEETVVNCVLKLASGNVVRRRGVIIQLCDSTLSLS